MTDPSPVPPAAEESAPYFRGASVAFDRRQAIRVAAVTWLGLLVVLLVVLSITALGDTSRKARLQHRGVPVTVQVTSCVAVASGTGETVSGSMCYGTYALGGRTHAGLVHGMPATLPAGSTVQAIVDPAHPSTLSTARSVAAGHASWEAFIPAGVVALILLASLAAVFGRARASGRGGVEPGGVEPGGVEPGGVEPGGVEPGGVEPDGVEPGGVTGGWREGGWREGGWREGGVPAALGSRLGGGGLRHP